MMFHPKPHELSRGASEGLAPAIAQHVARCESCADRWAGFQRIDELALELSSTTPTTDRTEATLASILRAVSAAPAKPVRQRIAWWQLAIPTVVACAAAIAFVWFSREKPTPPAYRAVVHADAGARFVRESSAPNEVVRLFEGSITLDVPALTAHEHVRVVVADAVIDVRGAKLAATAKSDALVSVAVESGSAELSPAHGTHVVLLAGQRWDANVEPVRTTLVEEPLLQEDLHADALATTAPPRAVKKRQQSIMKQETPPSPAQKPAADLPMAKLFERGFEQLKAGKTGDALAVFDEALAKYGSDPLAEDVMFWRAVALKRMSRKDAATAFTAFIDRFPNSPRAGEASTMLGWMLYAGGKLDAAEARFRAAANDPVASVRDSAERGLAAVASKR